MSRTETSLTNILGQQFGPYKLTSRLGVGGMAETFVAIRSGPGDFTQRVCLKLVLPFFRDDESFIRLFEREARLAAKLRHRNIVGVIDFGEIEGISYMALELVDGVDLRQLLDSQGQKRLAPEFVALLGLELSEALEHAHKPIEASGAEKGISDEQGIVHRDISPSNVLLSRQGEVFLTDFGVAKAISGGSRKQSAVKGKVPYMSPEHLRAEPLDGRADLFSLGVVLFEALAGKRPYEGAHDPATILRILKGDHEPLATLAPEAPPGLCEVIDALIDPDRDKRPANAAVLFEELDQFAPSRKSRRILGRMVVELRDATDKLARQRTEGPAASGTEVLSENPDETTGINRTTEPPPRLHELAPTPDVPKTEPLEKPATNREADAESRALESGTSLEGNARGPESSRPAETPDAAPAPEPPQAEDEPLLLVRPPNYAGLRAGELLDSVAERPRKPATQPRRPALVGVVAALLVLGSISAAVLALWPSSESADDAPVSEGASEEVGVAAERDPDVESDGKASPAVPFVDKSGENEQAEAEPPPVPVNEERTSKVEQPIAEPAPPVSPKQTKAQQRQSKDSRARRTKPEAPERQQRPPQTGKVTVTVVPWGDIWVDGQPWGPAPLKGEPMKPGTYRISAGRGKPEKSRTIELKPGQRRTVEFDLLE